jgi:hypothetical protein
MPWLFVALNLVNGYKTYAAAGLTAITGVGAILAKNYSGGFADILNAATLVFGAATVVGMRAAIAKTAPRGPGTVADWYR